MIERMRVRAILVFVTALVLSGSVVWQAAGGRQRDTTPGSQVNLADDPSLGKVADREGAVFRKPVGAERWTCAIEGTPIAPGDWIKTAARGAHAAEVRLTDGARLTLGPGGLVEIPALESVRLHAGELEVQPAEETKVEVEGPGGASLSVKALRVLRSRDGKLTALEREPRWLQGYRAKASTEALGSLLANVDGRDVPLTIGYHKVTVDIRDQIARTRIEESFANHTDHVLEGVFYFPLPQEASISGFALWIGNELVEADIVEKERARAIYEQILSEKRDPGLLEWTGGNIFKARVYPIPSRAEKRIRITYTQVLPREGSTYRYSYPLRSEMLKLTPLRELKLDVEISSAAALASVTCPSHTARIRTTAHAAQIEFAAEEYSPRRDFEVVVETAPSKERAMVVSHLRGNEGYFMVLFSAGDAPKKTEEEKGERTRALDLVILADTSGSMTDTQLAEQRLFIESLLESLSEKDHFRLLAFDVKADWLFEDPVPATPENCAKAMDFLESRAALGWTDLDQVFREVVPRAGRETHVVYVGDGIVVRGDADPAAFASRVKGLYQGDGNFHAVAVGSTYDLTVLKAIAGLGAGSLHRTGGGKDAPEVAAALLDEITSPVLRDISLEWKGVRVARVYPENLPALPPGRQQIILGRYLPEAANVQATLRVRGTMDGEEVTSELPVTFAKAGEGNSFIPRLWARTHLDYLLALGPDPEVRERIVALSEDFQIITPYTSLLVLESDADRERFAVKKRFRMRGGEEFFAEGRDRAKFELARKQMLLAKRWRLGIQRQVYELYKRMGMEVPRSRYRLTSLERFGGYRSFGGIGGDAISKGLAATRGERGPSEWSRDLAESATAGFEDLVLADFDELGGELTAGALARDFAGEEEEGAQPLSLDLEGLELTSEQGLQVQAPAVALVPLSSSFRGAVPASTPTAGAGLVAARPWRPRRPSSPFASLFPRPSGVRRELRKEPIRRWPAEVREIVEKPNRRSSFGDLDGGLKITVEWEAVDDRGRTRPQERASHLLSAGAWASRSQSAPRSFPYLRWLREGTRGVLDLTRLLGSTRKAEEGDAGSFPSPYPYAFDDLESSFPGYIATVSREGRKATLRLVRKSDRRHSVEITIDLERSVVEAVAFLFEGTRNQTRTFSEFTEVAGRFWPGKIEFQGADGKLTRTARLRHEALAAEAFRAEMDKALTPLGDAVLLELPLPKLSEAKQKSRDGNATFPDRWVLMNHFAATQRWEPVKTHFAELGTSIGGKAGLEWIRLEVLKASRRNEEAREEVLTLAAALAQEETPGDFAAARFLHEQSGYLQDLERLDLLARLRPVFDRQDPRIEAPKLWSSWRGNHLRSLGRVEEDFERLTELAGAYPDDRQIQLDYVGALVARGRLEEALAHVSDTLGRIDVWTEEERSSFRGQAAYYLFQHHRLTEYLNYVDEWVREKPGIVREEVMSRYLSCLVFLDRTDEADGLMRDWLALRPPADEAPAGAESWGDRNRLEPARFHAALAHALSDGTDLGGDRIEEQWMPTIVELARRYAVSERWSSITDRIVWTSEFRRRDEWTRLEGELYELLVRGIDTLAPQVVRNLHNWTQDYRPEKDRTSREELYEKVFSRWEKEDDPRGKGLFAEVLHHGGPDLVLKLRRAELARAEDGEDDEERARAAHDLFYHLLSRPWSDEAQAEILNLVPRLGHGDAKALAKVSSMPQLRDYLVRKRAAKESEEIPERNRKSRRELKPLVEAIQNKAKEAAIAVLRRLEGSGLAAEVVPFVRIERLSLEAQLDREPARLSAELKGLFREIPAPDAKDQLKDQRHKLAGRCLLTMAFIATRPEAEASLAEGLLEFLDELIASEDEDQRRVDSREHKYWLLVALDHADDLETLLPAWAEEAGEVAGNRWRVPYGYILAERGKLEEAVKVLEGVEAEDELGPAEYRALAGWYLALDRKEKNREARIAAYEVLDEWRIQNILRRELGRYQRSGKEVPEELDEEVLLRFAALLRKSTRPEDHARLLRRYYEATKDFRLLEALPEAVVGQSAARIYPFLEGLGQLAALIGDEATSDRLLRHLRGLLEASETPLDRRALRLLEFLVENKPATQATGAEPHVTAALAAMKAAFKEKWTPGEPRLMAGLLASLGQLVEPLHAEQLGQLRSLHDREPPGTEDRFAIASHRARALHANGRLEEAIQVLGAALREHAETHGGLLPASSNDELATYVSYLVENREFRAAERIWRRERSLDHPERQKRWIAIQLDSLYVAALREDGQTSLGRGEALYHAAKREIIEALERRTDERHAEELVGQLGALFREAHRKKIAGAATDVSDFAFRAVPRVLQMYNYRRGQNLVSSAANTMRDIVGRRATLPFLVARAENEPRWLERQGNQFWRRNGYLLGKWAMEVKARLGELEPRILAIVLKALREDLREGRSHRRMLYYKRRTFWEEKADDFFRVALEVLRERKDSEEGVKYIADYLYHGLERHAAAIEALMDYHRRAGLGEDGQKRLVTYLQARNRHAESLPLAVDLVEAWPDKVDYRAFLLRARFHTNDPDQLAADLEAADAHFHEERRWSENAAWTLGDVCVEVKLFESATGYLQEAIGLRKQTARNRGVGEGTLSRYYDRLARACAGMSRTKEAVDAAAGAVISWGQNEENRKRALEGLREVLREAKDLDTYAAQLEKESEETGLENPIVRKALGQVYAERREFAKAVRHLEVAVEQGRTDPEAQRALVEAYDGLGDPDGAAWRLLSLARRKTHDFALFKELGERYAKAGRRAEAERASTSLVEFSANESEGRALLAEVREAEGRPAEAVDQWRQVLRVRSREPGGYVGLGRALLAAGRPAEAREALEKVLGQTWPSRFGDVHAEARKILQKLER